MSIREDPGVGVRSPDVVVSSREPAAKQGEAAVTVRRPRWSRAVLAVVIAAIVLALVVLGVSRLMNSNDVAAPTKGKPPADKLVAGRSQPAALALSAVAPVNVVAGRAATIQVAYTDSSGLFSGTTEDWGDGVGTSSLKQAACTPTATAAPALHGTYTLQHMWARPGTYSVKLEVVSYTCRGTVAVEETATKAISVTVSRG
jgi:hypothetical protein